jgi:two-component system sensor histidine kinase/response regulator
MWQTQPPMAERSTEQQYLDRISELEEQVSNLRRLETTLERNNAMFNALLTAARDGITLTRVDGTIIRVVQSVFGFKSNDVCGMSLFDLLHPDDRSRAENAHKNVVNRLVPQTEIEARVVMPDGSIRWVQDTIRDMLDDVSVQAIVHNYRDITFVRSKELAASELAAVIEFAPFAVFSKDLQGFVQTWNAGAEALFGYTGGEIIGEHIWKLVPIEKRSEEEEQRTAVIQGARALPPVRTSRIHKDGTILTVDLVLAPLLLAGRVQGIAHLSVGYQSDQITLSSVRSVFDHRPIGF